MQTFRRRRAGGGEEERKARGNGEGWRDGIQGTTHPGWPASGQALALTRCA